MMGFKLLFAVQSHFGPFWVGKPIFQALKPFQSHFLEKFLLNFSIKHSFSRGKKIFSTFFFLHLQLYLHDLWPGKKI